MVQTTLAQAKLFLQDADEFYPFGTILTKENELKPCGVFLEEENPSSSQIFKLLESYVLDKLAKKECMAAVICLDVLINSDIPKPALDIRIYHQDIPELQHIFFLYTKEEGAYSFKQVSDL